MKNYHYNEMKKVGENMVLRSPTYYFSSPWLAKDCLKDLFESLQCT